MCAPAASSSLLLCLLQLCGADWYKHGACNRPVDGWRGGPPTGKEKDGVNELRRYAFYFERYINHKRASAHARRNADVIDGLVTRLLAATGASAAEYAFVAKARELIVRGQRIAANRCVTAQGHGCSMRSCGRCCCPTDWLLALLPSLCSLIGC